MSLKMFMDKEKFNKRIVILAAVWLLLLNMVCVAEFEKESGILYVLIWTKGDRGPFSDWPRGRKSLQWMNCEFQNCYFTDNKAYFLDPIDYEAILFNAPDIRHRMKLPLRRSDKQIYVFVSTESEANFPISVKYKNFFNYTWTYKLNSDIPYPYFYVRNKFNGEVIAPSTTVNWRKHYDMKPTPKSVIKHLQKKSICAAWFVTNCNANNQRLDYVRELRSRLHKLGQNIDIYGNCDANKICPRHEIENCHELVNANYYFYLSFENSFGEDYVTEKVMTAVDNYAIPVVFGGANYSRFLPEGAYLDARKYTPETLAFIMDNILKHRQDYYDYFKFHRYYSYHTIGESEDIDPLCNFCKFINNASIWQDERVYPLFSQWWNTNYMMADMIGNISIDQFSAAFPEWFDTTTAESDNSNFFLDLINYYYKSRK